MSLYERQPKQRSSNPSSNIACWETTLAFNGRRYRWPVHVRKPTLGFRVAR